MWYINVNGKTFSHCGLGNKDRQFNISVKEFINSIQGQKMEVDFEEALATFGISVLTALGIEKSGDIRLEIYKKDEKEQIEEIDLSSDALEVCVLVDHYNKVLRFNGIDCDSSHIEPELAEQIQKRWRILLSDAYGIKDEIIATLLTRKENEIKAIEENYNKQSLI